MTWEYMTLSAKKPLSEDTATMNALGAEGWELVAVTKSAGQGLRGVMVDVAYFKRPRP